jgi:hypothetical protein
MAQLETQLEPDKLNHYRQIIKTLIHRYAQPSGSDTQIESTARIPPSFYFGALISSKSPNLGDLGGGSSHYLRVQTASKPLHPSAD